VQSLNAEKYIDVHFVDMKGIRESTTFAADCVHLQSFIHVL